MAERKQTVQAANLQTKKRRGKLDKAHALSGLDHGVFESAWLQIPEGIRKKCTAAELAALVQILAQKSGTSPGNREKIGESAWNRAKIAWNTLQERRRATIFRAPVRLSLPGLRSALTAVLVRLPWVSK